MPFFRLDYKASLQSTGGALTALPSTRQPVRLRLPIAPHRGDGDRGPHEAARTAAAAAAAAAAPLHGPAGGRPLRLLLRDGGRGTGTGTGTGRGMGLGDVEDGYSPGPDATLDQIYGPGLH